MDSLKKRQEITALIDNIKTHSDRLTNNLNIPILELSVILSKINRLQEKTVILKYLMASEKNMDVNEFDKLSKDEFNSTVEEEPKTEQSTSSTTKEQENQDTDDSEIKPSTPSAEKQTEHSSAEEEYLIEKEDKTSKPEEESQLKEQINPVKKEIIEDIERSKAIDESKADIPDLNKQYTEEEDPSLGEQLKKQPISDLMTAIGLNERYLFANELFEGEMEKFREAIKILNEFDQRVEAIHYFNETLLQSQRWKADNEMVKALYLLVERRYQ